MKHERTEQKLDYLINHFSDPAFPDDKDSLVLLKAQFNSAILKSDLGQHENIKEIIEYLRGELQSMTEMLISTKSDKLPDSKRNNVIDRRELYIWFIGFFADADKEVARIVKDIETEYNNYGRSYEIKG